MFLRSRITTAVALAAALATAGCGSDSVGPGEFEIDDLVGSWTITRFEYQADSGDETYDLIDNGLSGTAVVQSSGDYTFTVQQTGLPAITTTGRFTIVNGNVVDTETGGTPETLDIQRDGDKITITSETETFDFDDDANTPESAADLIMEWEKN